MRLLFVALLTVLVSGCAQYQRPQTLVMPHKAPITKAAPSTPNEAVKQRFDDKTNKRWYKRFKWTH